MTEEPRRTLDVLRAGRAAGRTALVFGGREHSYADLGRRVDALAAALRADGMAGERVALLMPNRPEILVAYLACFAAGAIATPLNYRFAPPEIAGALRRAEPRWLLADPARLDDLERIVPSALGVRRLLAVGAGRDGRAEALEPLLASDAPPSAGPPPGPLDPAVMFFTSGSTGVPKGVVHSHASALAILESTSLALEGVGPDDVTQVCEPLYHVSGFIASLTTLHGGGRVVLLDGFALDAYLASMAEHRPTLVCTHVDILARLLESPAADRERFASLRGVYTGGDVLSAGLARAFHERAGLPIQVGWGMTEAIWLTIAREPRTDRLGALGEPIPGVELRIVDETGRDVGSDEAGELRVRGPMVMLEYWRDPDLTRWTLADGWLRTGDLGTRDPDGAMWFAGRIKDLIVRRTSKITPGEVEAAIDLHPDVRMSAVIGVPDPQEGEVPVAFAVPEPGRDLDVDGLVAFLRVRIAAYKIPARTHVVAELPLTRTGKVDHHALREVEGAREG